MLHRKVCHISTVHPADDVRIFYKECRALAEAGYDVTLIAPHSKSTLIEDVKIVALPSSRNRISRMVVSTARAAMLALREGADVYHFHDPELLPVGVLLKLLGKRVVYDVHENVSESVLAKGWLGNALVRRLISRLFSAFEQFSVSFFDAVVAATPDIGKLFSRRTVVIRNVPRIELVTLKDSILPASEGNTNSAIIYVGGLVRIRGIKQLVTAMSYLDNRVELWLLGEWESPAFREECEQSQGWKNTKYRGFIPYDELFSIIQLADIGIVTLYPIPNYLTSVPTKAFEYMTCGLPVVMSHFPYWQKLFDTCALFCDPYQPEDIAEKIRFLLDNPQEAITMGQAGQRLVREGWNWSAESKRLVWLYENITAEKA